MAQTLFEKIWKSHTVVQKDDGPTLLYVDRHLVHEVTSPQAFAGLRETGRKVRRPDLTVATVDHNVPTEKRTLTRLQMRFQVQQVPASSRLGILDEFYAFAVHFG